MEGALYHMLAADKGAYERSYDITIPSLTQFSANADGSSPSWKNLKIGSKYVQDGKDYVITGIERIAKEFKTKIRCEMTSRFAFTTPSQGIETPEFLPELSRNTGVLIGYATENITKGCAVCKNDDGTISLMKARLDYKGRFCGFAMDNALAGMRVDYKLAEEVECDIWTFTPGLKVVIRYSPVNALNLSHDNLLETSVIEDTHISVGTALTSTVIKFDYEAITHYPVLEA